MLSIPSNIFQSSASRNFELLDGHLSEVDRLLDGSLEPSATRKIQCTLKRMLNKIAMKNGTQNERDIPTSSQDEANAVQDNLSLNFEREDLFRDDPPNSTYGSLEFPVSSSLMGCSSHERQLFCAPTTNMT
jgi:hypothetical protein